MSDDREKAIGRALGKIPSGLFIVTARAGEQRGAMLASWVQQAAFVPPTISIAIAASRDITALIRQAGTLAVNIIPRNDTAMLKRFARRAESSRNPFEDIPLLDRPGAPILRDALAWLECQLTTVCDIDADHQLFIARVVEAQVLREGPAFTHQRGNGFHY